MRFCIWTVPRMRGNLASFSVPFSSLSSWPAGPMSPANVMLLTLFDWIMKKMTFLKLFRCNGVLIYAQFGFSTWRAQLWVLALTVYDASFLNRISLSMWLERNPEKGAMPSLSLEKDAFKAGRVLTADTQRHQAKPELSLGGKGNSIRTTVEWLFRK